MLGTSRAAGVLLALALIGPVACASPPADDGQSGAGEPGTSGGGPVPISEAAGAVLAAERFSFAVEWENHPFGHPDEPSRARGRVDIGREIASYEPLLNPSGTAEARIIGDDMYIGVFTAPDEADWEVSRGQPDVGSWMELMPMSGWPVQALGNLAELDDAGAPVEVEGQGGRECREYDAGGEGGPPRPVLACQEDGFLRWVQYPQDHDGGPLTTTFDDIGVGFDVETPKGNVTELDWDIEP